MNRIRGGGTGGMSHALRRDRRSLQPESSVLRCVRASGASLLYGVGGNGGTVRVPPFPCLGLIFFRAARAGPAFVLPLP